MEISDFPDDDFTRNLVEKIHEVYGNGIGNFSELYQYAKENDLTLVEMSASYLEILYSDEGGMISDALDEEVGVKFAEDVLSVTGMENISQEHKATFREMYRRLD